MNNQTDLALKYVPHFRYDKKESFSVEAIGYTVFTEDALEKDAVCNELAGYDGLLIAPMFEGILFTNAFVDEKVKQYIRNNYCFEPSWEFVENYPGMRKPESVLIPYVMLEILIVYRVQMWKKRICEVEERE